MLATSKNRSAIGEPPEERERRRRVCGQPLTLEGGAPSPPGPCGGGGSFVARNLAAMAQRRQRRSGRAARGPGSRSRRPPQVPDQGRGVSVGVALGVSLADASAAGLPVALGVDVGVRSMVADAVPV